MTHKLFSELPRSSEIATKPNGAELRSRIVSLVIDAYYDPPPRAD